MIKVVDTALFSLDCELGRRSLSYVALSDDGEIMASVTSLPQDAILNLTDEIKSGMLFYLWNDLVRQYPEKKEALEEAFRREYGVDLC